MFSTLKCIQFSSLRVKGSYISYKNYRMSASQYQLYNEIYVLNSILSRKLNTYKADHSKSVTFKPLKFQEVTDTQQCGEELTGPLSNTDLLRIVNQFSIDNDIICLSAEHGISDNIYKEAMSSFTELLTSNSLPTELHVMLHDLINYPNGRHLHELFPYFKKHAENIFPHLDSMDNLQRISDMTKPVNWYPRARAMKRKIIFHSGPTNSGKTHEAMKRFMETESAIYGGPLKMLAVEIFKKANEAGTPCDLLTGDNQLFAVSKELPSNHLSSTVEMMNHYRTYDVAVIDEIQMVRDKQRGWAWTRALLGVAADEVHVCGEDCAIDVVKRLVESTGDQFELKKYKRLTKLTLENEALQRLDNVQPGDCIVCFSMKDIHMVVKSLEILCYDVAVIYGSLPPGAKAVQAEKFNDPNQKCNIMVSTDAIGMGLNLNIRRIVFNSLIRPTPNDEGVIEMAEISVSSALQIAGRAGRYGSKYKEGFVSAINSSDLVKLKKLMETKPSEIIEAGLHPNADQIEMFSYHLRNSDMCYLIDVFSKLCQIDNNNYFVCMLDNFRFLADLTKHIDLNIRSKYIFCTAPINIRKSWICSMLVKIAEQYSKDIPINYKWMQEELCFPFRLPTKVQELVHLEEVHDVFELYFWLGFRLDDMFLDREDLLKTQQSLDAVIQESLANLGKLLPMPKSKCNNKYHSNNLTQDFDFRQDPHLRRHEHEHGNKYMKKINNYLYRSENGPIIHNSEPNKRNPYLSLLISNAKLSTPPVSNVKQESINRPMKSPMAILNKTPMKEVIDVPKINKKRVRNHK